MTLPRFLVVLMSIALLVTTIGCSTAPAKVVPTPNIAATVEASVKQELAPQVTRTPVVVVRGVVPTDSPEPTDIPHPATKPQPVPTSTPLPTTTPIPTPTPTSIPISTLNPVITPFPTPIVVADKPENPTVPHGATGPGVYLIAGNQRDEVQNTYALISGVLGGNPLETPDCAHPEFGPHITEEWDDILEKNSFVFHIHVKPDNDGCLRFDRQRNEIKTYGASPPYLKGFLGETVTYRWRFKLDEGFQPSNNFTHIHQIKAVGGDDSHPVIVLTPRVGSIEVLEVGVAYLDGLNYKTNAVATAPLSIFKGVWVEAYERIIYGEPSSYRIELRNLMSGDLLLTYDNAKLDLWRPGVEFMRPKWGIYRSLNSQEYLRDEQVRFDRFCLANGSHGCP
jgi:hypothetical protein